jgi:predicted nucleic acid-binding protein
LVVATRRLDTPPKELRALVDTNTILPHGFRLTTPEWATTLQYAQEYKYTLLVPEVVVLETVQKFRERTADFASRSIADQRTLGLTATVPDVEAEVAEYERWLRHKIATAVDGRIPPIPSISHEDLIKKAVEKIHPFKPNGSGYRDALIWQTVLVEASSTQVAFVTKDHDFGIGDVLYPELVAEVEALGFGSDRVAYFGSLFDLNRWVGPPSEEIIEKLNSGVMKSTAWRNELFRQTSPDVVGVPVLSRRTDDDTSSLGARSGGNPLVVAVSSLVDIELYDALIINETEAWAKFRVIVVADVAKEGGVVESGVRTLYFVDVVYDRATGTLGAHDVYDFAHYAENR